LSALCSARAALPLLASSALVSIVASCAAQGEAPLRPLVELDGSTDAPIVIPGPDAAALQLCTDGRWCAVASPVPAPYSFNGIWGSGPANVWIVGSPDIAIHWNGVDFSSARLGTKQTLFGIWGSGPTDVWAFSTGDVLWHHASGDLRRMEWMASHGDAGGESAWTSPVHGMWGRGAADVWAIGSANGGLGQATVWHCDGWNGGAPGWVETRTTPGAMPWDSEPSFNAIWGDPDGEVWVVGDGGKTRYSSGWKDGAATWVVVDSGTSLPLHALWGTGNEIWAAGAAGTVRRFARQPDGTVTTDDVAFPNRATIRALAGFASNDIWAGGSDGTLAHWDGTAWELVDIGVEDATSREIFALWASGPEDVWAVGRNVFLHKGSTLLPGTATP